jgi:hypothetical protein
MRKVILLPLGIVLGLVIFLAVVFTVSASQFAPQSNSSLTGSSHVLDGKVGDTLVTPEGVHITLVATEQHGSQLLFHLKVHNAQGQPVRVWNVDADHGFALYNRVTQAYVITPTTIAQTDIATHRVLPTTANGQATIDGWIAFIAPSSYESTLFYRYRTVHTMGCPNPGNPPVPIDRSKCWPADLYSTVHWRF